MTNGSFAWSLEELVFSTLKQGREIGRELDEDPNQYKAILGFGLSAAMNTLGCPRWLRPVPFELPNGQVINELTLFLRCVLYEALGYVDPNLIAASPGPGMAAFVVNGIGNNVQKRRFFKRFATSPTWSFFALTEPGAGSDAGQIATTATPVEGGYKLNGQKYLIGNGSVASVGVVFARTAPGTLGIDAFLIERRDADGLTCHHLPMTGCRGGNLAHLVFKDVFVPNDGLLGGHLKPTERVSSSAAITFDALRPCVAAIALGIARSVLDEAKSNGLLTCESDLLIRAHLDFKAFVRAFTAFAWSSTLECEPRAMLVS